MIERIKDKIQIFIIKLAFEYLEYQKRKRFLIYKQKEEIWRKERLPFLKKLTRNISIESNLHILKKIGTNDPNLALAERIHHSSHHRPRENEKEILNRIYEQ